MSTTSVNPSPPASSTPAQRLQSVKGPRWRPWLGSAAVGLGLLLVFAQLLPYGRTHANPPVRQEPAWDSPGTRALANRACFDCHSNETNWVWYTSIAPVSWLAQGDVDRGRRELNFSEWDQPHKSASKSVKSVQNGSMPPAYYTLLHPDARLSAIERQALMDGLSASLGGSTRSRAGED